MIAVSDQWKRDIIAGNRDFKNYADITLSDGTVLNLVPSDFMVGGCTITDATTSGSKFEVGAVVGKQLTIRLQNFNDKFSGYDFYGATIWLYIALYLSDGTTEKIRKGKYYVTTPETPGNIIEILAVDDMWKLNRPYAANTVFPATPQRILADCCADCGIPIGFGQLDNYVQVQNKPDKVTYHNVFSYICQILGHNARVDNNGFMRLVWYDYGTDNTEAFLNGGVFDGGTPAYLTGDTADGGNFTDYSSGDSLDGGSYLDDYIVLKSNKSIKVSTDDVTITGVKIINEKEEVLVGTADYAINISENPCTIGIQQQVANFLGNKIIGFTFRPFTAQTLCNPVFESFDTCRVVDQKGNIYRSIMNHISFKIGGYTTISCKAEDPIKNGSVNFNGAAYAITQARKNTDERVTEYDKAVQNMNALAINAMGLFMSYEDMPDESRITYLHNKPRLEDSNIIYKMTADGFFLSQDGGKSYTAGFDSAGNAVLNVLNVVGIVADWIKTGTLTVGGMDNTRGRIEVLDAAGNLYMSIDNTGMRFHQNTGTISAASWLEIQAMTRIWKHVFLESNLDVRENIYIYGLSNLKGGADVTGNVNISNELNVTGKVNAESNLDCNGLLKANNGLKVGNGAKINGGLTIQTDGLSIEQGDVVVKDRIFADRHSYFNGGMDILNGLWVYGTTNLNDGVNLGGNINLNGNIGFFGAGTSGKRTVTNYTVTTPTVVTLHNTIESLLNVMSAYGLINVTN